MTIVVTTRRVADIDLTEVETDDALLLHMERGTPLFLHYAKDEGSCLRRWRYALEGMWPVDERQFENVLKEAVSEGHVMASELATADVLVYTGFNIVLDRPLKCTVEAVWRDGAKRYLGSFESGGGILRSISAVKLPARV